MAITRKEALLSSISGGESANVSPITREEQYLSYIAGESNSYPNQPITREEIYLDKIAKSGVSGGSGVNVQSLSVTENGTYTAPSGVAYSPIFVDVEAEEIPTQEKTVDITENGTTEITADEGYLLSKVTANVNVASSGGGGENKFNQLVTKTITEVTAEDMEGATMIPLFNSCASLVRCHIPNTISYIPAATFVDCTSLESIVIPNSVTSAGSQVFQGCTSLKSCIMKDSQIKIMQQYFFDGCTSLESIVLPDSMTENGLCVFRGCKALKSIIYGKEHISFAPLVGSTSSKNALDSLELIRLFSESPPSLQASYWNGIPETCRIEVPAASVDTYKAATNWSVRADQIVASEEF